MVRVIAVGSINTDLVVRVDSFPAPGETVLGQSFNTYAGGKGANQAAAAARLGAEVIMVGGVGDDAYSPERVRDLEIAGVDTARIRTFNGSPGGIAVIQVESSGQNQIVLVPGANGLLQPDDISAAMEGLTAPGDIMCTQLELPLETVRKALEIARDSGAKTVVNAAPIINGSETVLPLIDVLVVNEIEAGQLLGEGPVSLSQACTACERLLKTGPSVVFATLGAAGAVLHDGEACTEITAPEVEVVDTTGAGDASVGGFVAGLAAGKSYLEAARYGVATGSFAVQRSGAQPSQPTFDELSAFIREHALIS